MSTKDPFTIFADELTLLRGDLKQLQRSSLSIEEAKALNTQIAQALKTMSNTARTLDTNFQHHLAITRDDITEQVTIAAKAAAANAIQTSHAEIMAAARIYAKNAAEARREAWRYFGGFWVWLTTIGALGAILGILAAIYLQGILTADAFGKYPSLYCTSAGGTKGKFTNGKPYCLFELD